MQKYYFTFGKIGAESGGWIVIKSDTEDEAKEIFDRYYGGRARFNGMANYSDIYTEQEFKKTCMYRDGNLGNRGWGEIK